MTTKQLPIYDENYAVLYNEVSPTAWAVTYTHNGASVRRFVTNGVHYEQVTQDGVVSQTVFQSLVIKNWPKYTI